MYVCYSTHACMDACIHPLWNNSGMCVCRNNSGYCMHVCMFLCTAYLLATIQVFMNASVCMHALHACMYICMYSISAHVGSSTLMHVCFCTMIHVCMHTCYSSLKCQHDHWSWVHTCISHTYAYIHVAHIAHMILSKCMHVAHIYIHSCRTHIYTFMSHTSHTWSWVNACMSHTLALWCMHRAHCYIHAHAHAHANFINFITPTRNCCHIYAYRIYINPAHTHTHRRQLDTPATLSWSSWNNKRSRCFEEPLKAWLILAWIRVCM
jgi:hypothetical protein